MGTQAVWDLLRRVSDPEIPVLSIVDLGIVRGVQFDGDACVITITPTYSGCPAMDVISREVKTALHDEGIDNVRVDMQLSPAWTTDWMTEDGKRALASYGIAPPSQKVVDISSLKRRGVDEPVVACPLCHSARTQLVSQFGSTSCKALYKCLDCREPFDYFKSH
ncbi:phenylacetate-CoA oxygenase subunit PaaJ [Massilia arenosa]|uniref:Phenylacetate-CoA oxygenase subunit PaaJ n=1 Tax=Zemynaea arenosa TaxID=2561931 RepID=A0A4Y9RNR8_9BURK|nr:1,2-phenylacetyl-CoA epoxidase subunit PaaD [Massilia arenosa]TFW10700.1 phenylacetate-CoA oxygenase subunit PaaJ [Massilia arenosa]